MFDWIPNSDSIVDLEPELPVLGFRLLMAWACGCVVAWIARRQRPVGEKDTLSLTLILMSILIAMATQIIGDNVARAFSLVGALSIVRFRTAVPATRDVAFVLAAVVVGMAVGAGQYWVALLGMGVVGLATLAITGGSTKSGSVQETSGAGIQWRVNIQIGLSFTDGWESELARFADSYQLVSAETTRRGSAMEMVYRLKPKSGMSLVEMVASLNALPAVESVSTKAI